MRFCKRTSIEVQIAFFLPNSNATHFISVQRIYMECSKYPPVASINDLGLLPDDKIDLSFGCGNSGQTARRTLLCREALCSNTAS